MAASRVLQLPLYTLFKQTLLIVNTMKIVYISLYRFLSFPVRVLHALSRREGVDSYALFFKDANTNIHKKVTLDEIKILLDLIASIQPDIIGISLLAPYAELTKELVPAINKISNAPVVIGGKYPTITPERALEFCDYACIGEGEHVMLEIFECFKNQAGYKNIKGLWYKEPNGNIVNKGQQPLLQNLDEWPFHSVGDPQMYFIENNRLTETDIEQYSTSINMMAGLGCFYKCSYCVNSLLIPMNKDNGKLVRVKTPRSLVNEITHFKDRYANPKEIYFHDEVFGVSYTWTVEFCEEYIKSDIKLPFIIEMIPKMIQEKNIALLADAGLQGLTFGIQSGSEAVRNDILSRPGKNSELIEGAYILEKYKIKQYYDLILQNPFETYKDIESTLILLSNMPEPFSLHVYKMIFFPNYPISEQALKAGHIQDKDLTDKAIANSAINNWVYIPKTFTTNRKQILENCIFTLRYKKSFVRRIIKRVTYEKSVILSIFLNIIAKYYYVKDFTKLGMRGKMFVIPIPAIN
jgi:anaerobic magnesium-protoporphyrin IX monomethyl ester cyclase